MINFRYHIVSLISVFLALGIGVIMGTAVLDNAVVDRLERQQDQLQDDVDEVVAENDDLRAELEREEQTFDVMAEEIGQRLLDGELADVPVLLVAVRGVESDGLDQLVSLLGSAGADYRGTLWLTDRFSLDDEGERRDLAEVLGEDAEARASALRSAALRRLARGLRPAAELDPDEVVSDTEIVPALVAAGFIDYDAPEGADGTTFGIEAGTRLVVAAGPQADVDDERLGLPLLEALAADLDGRPLVPIVAVSSPEQGVDDETVPDTFVGAIRSDEELAAQVASADHVDEFAGQLAVVLAVADLAFDQVGHYGRGDGAQSLLPPVAVEQPS